MSNLSEETCQACRADAPKVETAEYPSLLEQLPDWSVEVVEGESQLCKSYRFKNFVGALAFTNQVGELAEQYNHHPALLTEWGKVEVRWWTHKIGGLHKNDFILAAKTEQLLRA